MSQGLVLFMERRFTKQPGDVKPNQPGLYGASRGWRGSCCFPRPTALVTNAHVHSFIYQEVNKTNKCYLTKDHNCLICSKFIFLLVLEFIGWLSLSLLFIPDHRLIMIRNKSLQLPTSMSFKILIAMTNSLD